MNWISFRTLSAIAFLFTIQCGGDLEVGSQEFCPDYDAIDDVCLSGAFNGLEDTQELQIQFEMPPAQGPSTWKQWNHYIYFEKPITVGFLVRWSRDATLDERMELRKDLSCEFRIEHPETGKGINGHLEGKRLEENGLWCFDYLGTLLGELQKEEGILNNKPESSYFPVELTLSVESSKKHLRREVTRRILVNWR